MSSLRDEILRVCEGHCLRTGTSMDALSRRALGGDHHATLNLAAAAGAVARLHRQGGAP